LDTLIYSSALNVFHLYPYGINSIFHAGFSTMEALPNGSTSLISSHLFSVLLLSNPDKKCSMEEGNDVSNDKIPNDKVDNRVGRDGELPGNVLNQVCHKIHDRGTGTPMMFHHRGKYYVGFASACRHGRPIAPVLKKGNEQSTAQVPMVKEEGKVSDKDCSI